MFRCSNARGSSQGEEGPQPAELVIPVIFSAGGALRACDNDLLPEPEDRNGRHWMRVKLDMILIKFAFEISAQLWSPR